MKIILGVVYILNKFNCITKVPNYLPESVYIEFYKYLSSVEENFNFTIRIKSAFCKYCKHESESEKNVYF